MVGHSGKFSMWKAGEPASKGVEEVAETGSTGTIMEAFETNRSDSIIGESIQGEVQFHSNTNNQTLPDITLTPWFKKISSISMVAPSSDWFTGFSGVKPFVREKGSKYWLASFNILTYPFDAGTKTGDTYIGTNYTKEDPQLLIQAMVNNLTVPGSGVFLNPNQTAVEPLAEWKCTLTAIACLEYENVTQRGVEKRNCTWAGMPNKTKRRKRRCRKRFKRKRMSIWCPENCGMCSSTDEMQQVVEIPIML